MRPIIIIIVIIRGIGSPFILPSRDFGSNDTLSEGQQYSQGDVQNIMP
jgi:hypothetical protein